MIDESAVRTSLGQLSQTELTRVFRSKSASEARTALTRFSTHLVAAAAARIPTTQQLTACAAFKGNKSGRNGGGAGGLAALGQFAKQSFDEHGITYRSEERLLDFLVWEGDVLNPVLAAESEARCVPGSGTEDLDKLLLVASPNRLFIGRVNVTATGREDKVRAAEAALLARTRLALNSKTLRDSDRVQVVLLRTSSTGAPVFYLGDFSSTGTSSLMGYGTAALPLAAS